MATTEDNDDLAGRLYPEKGAGGFTSVDGTIEFYTRVNALLSPNDVVLDFGAGRAAWFDADSASDYKVRLRSLRGKVRRVLGADIDPVVVSNPTIDESIELVADEPLPFPDATFDVVVADYVFEHIADPASVAIELGRVVRPGGWICGRTPNKWGYVSIATRLVPNRRHGGVLRTVQPGRQERDVFPTEFRMNTLKDLRTAFPTSSFEHFTYRYDAEPAYHFGSSAMFRAMRGINRFMPTALRSNLFVFIRRRG